MATVMQKNILALFKTHTYSFGNKYFLQMKGGPIGLRSTCCVARLIMLWWDQKFLELVEKSNVKIVDGARYMDDVRVWLRGIRLGWRWLEGQLRYKRSWRQEEEAGGLTMLGKTTEVLKGMMNSICSWLEFTMETEEMFDGVLPTLDLELWVSESNKILYSFFEKSMVSKMVLHKRSAMPEGIRRATLNQEMVRRMLNTSEDVDDTKRVKIVDDYAQKMVNSEYTIEEARNVIVAGLKGYERLLSLSKDKKNPKWKPLHMAGSWNARGRRMAKLKAKTNWFKGKADKSSSLQEEQQNPSTPLERGSRQDTTSPEVPAPNQTSLQEEQKDQAKGMDREGISSRGKDGSSNKPKPKMPRKNKKRGEGRRTITLGGQKKQEMSLKRKLKRKINLGRGKVGFPPARKSKKDKVMNEAPISVLFIDNTKRGTLAKRLQIEESRLSAMTGYRIRVAEAAGTPLSMLLPSTNPWGVQDCARPDCIVCDQGDEKTQNCKTRNILYENRCTLCHDINVKEDKKTQPYHMDGKGIYVGESSRSMYERGKEHQKDREDTKEDSHQIKHWKLHHPDLEEPPKFKFKIVSSFSDPMTRQLAESVRIERRGENTLNSKSEYSRCRVPRLKIDKEVWSKKTDPKTVIDKDITTKEATEPHSEDKVTTEESRNAKEDERRRQDQKRKAPETGGRSKRRRLEKLEGWGEPTSLQEDLDQPTPSTLLGGGSRLDTTLPVVPAQTPKSWITMEISRRLEKPADRKSVIIGKKNFNFKNKGKLRKDEIVELKKTNINVFDWMKQKQIETPLTQRLEDDGHDEWLTKVMEKEERLTRMERRKQEWEAKMICRSLMEDILSTVSQTETARMSRHLVLEVIDSARRDSETNRLMKMIRKEGVWDKVKESMKKEEEMLAKEDRLRRQDIKRLEWKARLEKLELELAEEMKDVMEFDLDQYMMEVDVEVTEQMTPVDMEMEQDATDDIQYEDWVMKEMEEIEITWGPMIIDFDTVEIEMNVVKDFKDSKEESMVGEVSYFNKDPTPHGEVHPLSSGPIIITENGMELDWVESGHFTGDIAEHTPSPGPTEVNSAAQHMETDMETISSCPRTPNFVKNNSRDMIVPPTPALSFKMSRIELEDEECVCSYNCPGYETAHKVTTLSEHTPSPRPKEVNIIIADTDMETDMSKLPSSPGSPNFIIKNHVQDMIVPPTPGLSKLISRIELDDEECVCAYNCQEHETAPPATGLSMTGAEVENEHDECICKYSCQGRHQHEILDKKDKEKKEQILDIKYCPNIEMELPTYAYVEYKPRCSKTLPKLFTGFAEEGHGINEIGCQQPNQPSNQNQRVSFSFLSTNWIQKVSTKPSIFEIVNRLQERGMEASILPGPRRVVSNLKSKPRNIQLREVCSVSSGTLRDGTLLVGPVANQKRGRDLERDGHYRDQNEPKKLKVSQLETNQ